MTPARQHFIDDELLRVPLLAEQVVEATFEELRLAMAGAGPQERAVAADLMRTAEAKRAVLVKHFADSVRSQVRQELGIDPPDRPAAAPTAARPTLALLDETEIAADVEISHAIEAIKSVAEHELRELASFASALAGDMNVGRDHNPFRAETYARAMWDAAQALPMSRGFQVRLMRHASQPLDQLLRKAYAGACARLESTGIEPAVYRTVILPAGARSYRPGDSWLGRGPDLNRMRDTMPASIDEMQGPRTSQMPLERVLDDVDRALRALPAEAPLTERAKLLSSQRSRIVRYADKAVDQQLIELLSRLFDAILTDSRVPRDVQVTLSRLQPAVMRLALRDAGLLDDYVHPVWRFMDQIAHQASLLPDDSRARADALHHAESLIDTLARESQPDAMHYRWALERLATADRDRLAQRIQRAAPDIATLQALEDRLAERSAPLPTGSGPLDESQLETVPADLMDDLPPPRADAPDATTWLNERKPGDWVRLFRQGQWVRLQLLSQGRRGDAWLFGEIGGDGTVAMRRRALERLYDEGLANSVRARSLVRAAAEQIMRNVAKPAER